MSPVFCLSSNTSHTVSIWVTPTMNPPLFLGLCSSKSKSKLYFQYLYRTGTDLLKCRCHVLSWKVDECSSDTLEIRRVNRDQISSDFQNPDRLRVSAGKLGSSYFILICWNEKAGNSLKFAIAAGSLLLLPMILESGLFIKPRQVSWKLFLFRVIKYPPSYCKK